MRIYGFGALCGGAAWSARTRAAPLEKAGLLPLAVVASESELTLGATAYGDRGRGGRAVKQA